MSAHRMSITNQSTRRQSDADPPQLQMVKVAVLPPRLPPGMAPPTHVAAADAFSWDEAANYNHNNPIQSKEPGKLKAFQLKTGLTGQRKRANPDKPPFSFREVPYDTWRKHYAKDANGNYRGTHAPAMDCLLKPEDVAKWRLEEPTTEGDKWTRGAEILPVYSQVEQEGRAPEYDVDHHGLAPGEPTVHGSTGHHHFMPHSTTPVVEPPTGKEIADGKTAQQIIAEAKAKPKEKQGWRRGLKKGAEMVLMGS